MSRDIYVVAHAQSMHHVERRVGGWYDTGLTDLGRVQAGLIALRLRELIPEEAPVELYSSDLKRAHETAKTIASKFALSINLSADLREKSYGEAEGKPQSWLEDRFIHAPPDGNRMDHDEGIRGSETRRHFAERIYRAMERILSSPCQHQIIATHGGVLTFLIAAWIKMPVETAGHIGIKSTTGGISHLQQDDTYHNRFIVILNDTSHL